MLATLAELKTRLKITTTTDDALLTQILVGVDASIARACNRTYSGSPAWEYDADLKEEWFDGGGETIALAVYPVKTLVSVVEAADRNYTAATALTADLDYVLDANAGLLHRLGTCWMPGRRTVRVQYEGGYQGAVPTDLREAALKLATITYAHRDDPSRQSVSSPGGGGLSVIDPGKWPDDVRKTIEAYRRMGRQ